VAPVDPLNPLTEPSLLSAAADLLTAVLQPDAQRATAAFRAWQAAVVLDDLPADQFSLLPALVQRQQACGNEVDARLLGIVRRARVRRLQAVGELEQLTQQIRRAGLSVQTAGRSALLRRPDQLFDGDAVERLDLLVDVEALAQVTALLTADGWQVRGGSSDRAAARWGALRLLRHPGRPLPLYLQWRLTGDGPLRRASAGTLTDAELLIAAVGTARRGGMNGLRGLADAALLSRAAAAPGVEQIAVQSELSAAAADLLTADRLLTAAGCPLLTDGLRLDLRAQAQRQPRAAVWRGPQPETAEARIRRHLADWRRLCRHGRIAMRPDTLLDYLASMRAARIRTG
jgi:hypothetical protein